MAVPILPDKWQEQGGCCPQPRQLHLLPSISVRANLPRRVLTAESLPLPFLSKTASAWPETSSRFSPAQATEGTGQSDPWEESVSLTSDPHPTAAGVG